MVTAVLLPCSAVNGRSGNAGASGLPSHTHAMFPASWTGKWVTWTLAQNRSWRLTCVGASTTAPDTSVFHP